jgi:glucose-1-phosphate cytidylyltransferase
MKVVILAGGFGTRIAEESALRPKPMIEIGGRPILWHLMKIYSHYGLTEFIVCCGYKGYMIKEYFANYFLHMSNVTIDLKKNSMEVLQQYAEPWKVTLIDTGESSMTGGRLKRVADYLNFEEDFCFTYGDGLSDIDIGSLINFHKQHKRLATVTAVAPPGRYGALDIQNSFVKNFTEKPKGDGALINGGFFVLNPKVLKYIDGDSSVWEKEPLENLAKDGHLAAFEHHGFWQPMDTMRDKLHLEELWSSNCAPWKKWS